MRNSKYYPWIVVGLLWFVALLNYLDCQMLHHAVVNAVRHTRAGRGKLWTGDGHLPAGVRVNESRCRIADRVNRKWLIVKPFVWSAVTYGLGRANLSTVYWLRALMGVSEALYLPTGLAMIADFHTSKTRSLAIGIHMSGLYAGQALGGFGATIAANYSWHSVFHWFGIIGIIYAVILIFVLTIGGHAAPRQLSCNLPQGAGIKKESVFSSFAVVLHPLLLDHAFYFMAPSFPDGHENCRPPSLPRTWASRWQK